MTNYDKIPVIEKSDPGWIEFDSLPLREEIFSGHRVKIRDFSSVKENQTVRVPFKSFSPESSLGIEPIRKLQERHIDEIGRAFPNSQIQRSKDGSFMTVTFKK